MTPGSSPAALVAPTGTDLPVQEGKEPRMAFDVVLRRLRTREHGLDRPLQQVSRNRRLPLNRQLLFRAERAAARRQRDLNVCGIQMLQSQGRRFLPTMTAPGPRYRRQLRA